MKNLAKRHEWGGFYGPTVCVRCGAPEWDTKTCLTDNELKDRKEWKDGAECAAELMRASRRT